MGAPGGGEIICVIRNQSTRKRNLTNPKKYRPTSGEVVCFTLSAKTFAGNYLIPKCAVTYCTSVHVKKIYAYYLYLPDTWVLSKDCKTNFALTADDHYFIVHRKTKTMPALVPGSFLVQLCRTDTHESDASKMKRRPFQKLGSASR